MQNLFLQTFNHNTWKVIHIVTIYKSPKMQTCYFISLFKTILKKIPIHCRTIVIGNFNVDTLINTSQSMISQNIMNEDGFRNSFFQKNNYLQL
jgi:hypothetical protein